MLKFPIVLLIQPGVLLMAPELLKPLLYWITMALPCPLNVGLQDLLAKLQETTLRGGQSCSCLPQISDTMVVLDD